MSSEKYRYRYRGPSMPISMNQLRAQLNSFSKEHLTEFVWLSAESNSVLLKSLTGFIAIKLADGDWEKIKEAIDYVFYFDDIVRYNEEDGFSLIIEEMIHALEFIKDNFSIQLVLQAAEYIYENGQNVQEYFEEGWSWVCSLENLKKWISKTKLESTV